MGDGVGVNPEKKPPWSGWHGSSKLDWTTEWFCQPLSTMLLSRPSAGEGSYFGKEAICDGVADRCRDRVRDELQLATLADGDFVVGGADEGHEKRQGEEV